MVRCKHEALRSGRRTVDIGVHGLEVTTPIGVRLCSIYEPVLVIEAKRLPAPKKYREREFVMGTDQSSGRPTGGIQRFKLGLHGSDVESAAMIGYIKQHSPRHWHGTINGWITDLIGVANTAGCVWSKADLLQPLQINDSNRTAFSVSSHQRHRECLTTALVLHQLRVVMES